PRPRSLHCAGFRRRPDQDCRDRLLVAPAIPPAQPPYPPGGSISPSPRRAQTRPFPSATLLLLLPLRVLCFLAFLLLLFRFGSRRRSGFCANLLASFRTSLFADFLASGCGFLGHFFLFPLAGQLGFRRR